MNDPIEQSGPAPSISSAQSIEVTETRLTPEYTAAHADLPASKPSGGDFHAAFPLDTNTGDVAIVMGDVAGHGPEQTAQADHMREMLSDCLSVGLSPAESLSAVNAVLEPDPNFPVFGTVFAGVLEGETGKLTYASGGHEPALVAGASVVPGMESVQELAAAGPPVGAFPEDLAQYNENEVTVPDGGTLLLYTDGLPDAKHPNTKSEWLGLDRLKQIFAGLTKLAPRQLVSALVQRVSAFCRGSFFDDVSVMAVRREAHRVEAVPNSDQEGAID